MYSVPGRIWGAYDIVAALAADTGQTLWENKDGSKFSSSSAELSGGPRAMPQIVGGRLVTADSAGRLSSLEKQTGKVVWSHDLYGEYGGSRMQFGYSCHPLPYRDTLIVMVGGSRNSLMAFRQTDGSVVWGRHGFPNSHSSPVLINVDGQDQVVALMGQQVVAVNPATGDLLWQHPHPTQYRPGDQHAHLGSRQHPGGLFLLRGRYTCAAARAARRQDDGDGALAQLPGTSALRLDDQNRRYRLRVEWP